MNSFAKFQDIPEPCDLPAGREAEERKLVLSELERIMASPCFRSAERCKQFLKYVVEHKLAGHLEKLKERTIGTEVFLRPKNYSTGDDAVVRVQAGELRKKIEHYYHLAPNSSPVRIELPVGSYSPVFHWSPVTVPAEVPALPSLLPKAESAAKKSHRARYLVIAACCLIAAVGVGHLVTAVHRAPVQHPAYKSAIEQFWNPVFASQQPVVICLGANLLRPLGSNVQDAGGNTNTDAYLGAPIRDVYAALAVSSLLSKIGKPSEVRIGANCSFDDFRNSAAVAVGDYNNKLTLQLLASSHLTLAHIKGQYMIRELPPGNRVWQARIGTDGEGNDDFAIVSRQLDSRTGQFTITVAGTGPYATQSAANFVSNPQYLEQGLQHAPADWPKKNLVMILETMGANSIAAPPTVVASYVW